MDFISDVVIVSEESKAKKISNFYGANFLYAKELGVNHAVKIGDKFCAKNEIDCNIVIPIDLALLSPSDLFLIIYLSLRHEKCAIICPSLRKDGTNLLLRRPIDIFETSYDDRSYYNHIVMSREAKVHTMVISSMNIMLDVDTKEDILKLVNLFPENKLSRLLLATNFNLIEI
jgi:2-phospho-L-lactate guanylyltransferase